MGVGDWGLGIGDWGLAQSPIPNPQSPIFIYNLSIFKKSVFPFLQKPNSSKILP